MKKITAYSILYGIVFSNFLSPNIALGEGVPAWDAPVLQCIQGLIVKPQKDVSSIPNPYNKKQMLICSGNNTAIQKALYQAILDVLFTEVDQDVEKFLGMAFKGTSLPMDSLNDLQTKMGINGIKGSFAERYNEICKTKILAGALDFIDRHGSELNIKGLSTDDFTNDAYGGGSPCVVLYYAKLQSYYDAGEVIIKRESLNNFDYSKKDYMTKIKEKYRKLLFKFTTYLGQLKVINGKWYINTKNPKN